MFRKASQRRVFQDVVQQIQQAIVDGRLKRGERLPAEREMVEMFQTGRGTLREALRVLEQKGLIEIRLGVNGGAVVKVVGSEQINENLALLLQTQQVSLDHLAEFRVGIEGHVSALAALRAQPSDISELKGIVAEAETYCESTASHRDDLIRADERFHMALARITGNPLYRFILETVHDNIHRYYDRYLSMEEAELRENYRDLCNMAEAVENGDAEEARRLSQDHVKRFYGYMKNREETSTGPDTKSEPG
jgi:DNA-binding FadR family transcriptional regulator